MTEPRGVWLVNIDKRQQHVLTRDLCLPVPRGLCLRKVMRRLDWHLSGYTAVCMGGLRSQNQLESLQITLHTKGFFRHAEKTDAQLNGTLWVGFQRYLTLSFALFYLFLLHRGRVESRRCPFCLPPNKHTMATLQQAHDLKVRATECWESFARLLARTTLKTWFAFANPTLPLFLFFPFLQFAHLCTASTALPHLQKTSEYNPMHITSGNKYIAAYSQKTTL